MNRAALGLGAVSVGIFASAVISRPQTALPAPGVPKLHHESGYLGSGACRECHPSEHASFSRTYHRTMTRRSEDVPWDGQNAPNLPAHVEVEGRSFDLSMADGEDEVPRVTGPDLHEVAARLAVLRTEDARMARRESYGRAPSVTRKLPLVTGSHHYLAFWVENGDRRELRQLPFVYLLQERAFAPRAEVFLQPRDALPHVARWNGACIQCHSVAGMPKESEGSFDTQVAELGISCEACHGPGRAHAEGYRSPFARLAARTSGARDTYQNPARLPAAESSALCGQCHSYFVPGSPDLWWDSGFVDPNGGPKAVPPALPSRTLITWEEPERAREASLSRDLGTIFWPDGSVLVGGREYNGLIASACYERGQDERKLGCLSCHSMHDAEPSDQLLPDFESACTTCHESVGSNPGAHSHHPKDIGCADCHMPKTAYALMKSIASHRITVPRPDSEEPPSACALCHTTRSARWLREEGVRLFDPARALSISPPADAETGSEEPLAGRLTIAGGAVTRAILASALVEPEALSQSGKAYARTLLLQLESDPYPVVERIARRSLTILDRSQAPETGQPPPSEEELDAWHKARDTSIQIVSE